MNWFQSLIIGPTYKTVIGGWTTGQYEL